MELQFWIGKSINDIKGELFEKYFGSIVFEEIEGDFFLSNRELGIEALFDENNILRSIHLFSGRSEEMRKFIDELPFNLDFSMSRKSTRELLGMPDITGGGGNNPFLGRIPFWDKYNFGGFCLHIQFTDVDEILDMVTLDIE